MNTATMTIYYHKPKISRSGVLGVAAEDESKLTAMRNGVRVSIKSAVVSGEGVFNCAASTLRGLGLTGKYDGFLYMCKAVEQILICDEAPHFQNIYYDVGKEYKVNKCSVERSIRYSIGFIKKSGNKPGLSTFLGSGIDNDRSFSNSKFLTLLAADVYQKMTSYEPEEKSSVLA